MLKRNDIIFGADKGAFPRGCVGLSPGGRLRWVPGRKCPQSGLQSQGSLGTKDPEVGRSLPASVKINPRKSEAVEQFPVRCVGNLTEGKRPATMGQYIIINRKNSIGHGNQWLDFMRHS